MLNEKKYNSLKIILILSLICNLAFIGGFFIKKVISYSKNNHEKFMYEEELTEDKHNSRMREIFNKNPLLKPIFHKHFKETYELFKQVNSLRDQILEKVKSGKTDIKEYEGLLKNLSDLNTKIDRLTLDHFITLKKILGDEKFEQFTQKMKKMNANQTHKMNKFFKCSNQESCNPKTK